MHKRKSVHSLLIPCGSDYIALSALRSTLRALTSTRAQDADDRERQRAHLLPCPPGLARQRGPPPPASSALLLRGSFPFPTQMLRSFPPYKQETKQFPTELVAPLKYCFIFPFSLTAGLLLNVVLTSLTSPTLHSLLSPLELSRNCYLQSVQNLLTIKKFDFFLSLHSS